MQIHLIVIIFFLIIFLKNVIIIFDNFIYNKTI